MSFPMLNHNGRKMVKKIRASLAEWGAKPLPKVLSDEDNTNLAFQNLLWLLDENHPGWDK